MLSVYQNNQRTPFYNHTMPSGTLKFHLILGFPRISPVVSLFHGKDTNRLTSHGDNGNHHLRMGGLGEKPIYCTEGKP